MKFEMSMRENLMLMETVRAYRMRTATNQRVERVDGSLAKDLFWVSRNRIARTLYRRLADAT